MPILRSIPNHIPLKYRSPSYGCVGFLTLWCYYKGHNRTHWHEWSKVNQFAYAWNYMLWATPCNRELMMVCTGHWLNNYIIQKWHIDVFSLNNTMDFQFIVMFVNDTLNHFLILIWDLIPKFRTFHIKNVGLYIVIKVAPSSSIDRCHENLCSPCHSQCSPQKCIIVL